MIAVAMLEGSSFPSFPSARNPGFRLPESLLPPPPITLEVRRSSAPVRLGNAFCQTNVPVLPLLVASRARLRGRPFSRSTIS